MHIRESGDGDLDAVLGVERRAFGQDEEADLVRRLLHDPTAQPLLSLLALDDDGEAAGHILFTRVRIDEPASEIPAAILAPLAVAPEAQGKGVGGRLIEAGLQRLKESGVALVFVLGHPGYYPRFGFTPAGTHGLHAPYPIPQEHADAWMVRDLQPGILGAVTGTVRCADTLNAAEYWVE